MQRETGFMDWVDRIREQAAVMADKAQDVQLAGSETWPELQAQQEFELLLTELGELVYRQTILMATPERDKSITRTISRLRELEAELSTIDLRDTKPARRRPASA